jgi:hypothetical protein
MQRIPLIISWAALLITIIIGLCWNTGVAQADIPIEGSPECNCIDGFTNGTEFTATILTKRGSGV